MRFFLLTGGLVSLFFLDASVLTVAAVPILNSVVTPSPAANGENVRLITVYLPALALKNTEQRFPVIYYLPGLGGDNTSFTLGNQAIMDNLIAAGQVLPMIIVHVDPSVVKGIDTDGLRRYQGTWYVNSELNGNFEDFMVQDLIPFVDNNFPTLPSADFRGVVGQSMGGFGSMYYGINHPELFSAFGQASGTPFFIIADNTDAFAPDQPEPGKQMFVLNSLLIPGIPTSGPNKGKITPDNDPFAFSIFSYSGAFSPNLNNPPYFVDTPFQVDENGLPLFIEGDFFIHDVSTGAVIQTSKSLVPNHAVIERWKVYDPIYLVSTKRALLANSWVYCDGGNSELINAVGARFFADTLAQNGIPVEYILYSGGQGGHTDCLTTPSCSRHRTMFQLLSARFAQSLYPKLHKTVFKGTGSITMQDDTKFVLNNGSQYAIESDFATQTAIEFKLTRSAQFLIGSSDNTSSAVFQIGNSVHRFNYFEPDYREALPIYFGLTVDQEASFVVSPGSIWGIGVGVVTRATDDLNHSVIETLLNLGNCTITIDGGSLIANTVTPDGVNMGSLIAIGNIAQVSVSLNEQNVSIDGGTILMLSSDCLFRHPVLINQVGNQSAGGVRTVEDTDQGLLDSFLGQPISSQLAYSNNLDISLFTNFNQLTQNNTESHPFQLVNGTGNELYQFFGLNQNNQYDQPMINSKFAIASLFDNQIVLSYVDNGIIMRVPQPLIPVDVNRIDQLYTIAQNNGTVLIQVEMIGSNRVLVNVGF